MLFKGKKVHQRINGRVVLRRICFLVVRYHMPDIFSGVPSKQTTKTFRFDRTLKRVWPRSFSRVPMPFLRFQKRIRLGIHANVQRVEY